MRAAQADPDRERGQDAVHVQSRAKYITISSKLVIKFTVSVSQTTFGIEGNTIRAIDWSCNDMIAVSDYDRLSIYDSNGEKLSSYKVNFNFEFNKIIDVKWSNSGE